MIGARHVLESSIDDIDPAAIVGDQIDHGPVASEDEAVWPEDIDDRFQIGLHPLGRPFRTIFGQDTGELAMDVIELTELLHVTGPGREFSLVDHGLRHMVDDDREVRVALHKAERVDYVPRLDQGVETQAELGKLF